MDGGVVEGTVEMVECMEACGKGFCEGEWRCDVERMVWRVRHFCF